MITNAMLFWIGSTLNAPTWYWWCWWIKMIINFIQLLWGMYKAGRDS